MTKNVIASKLLLEPLAKCADDPEQATALTIIAQHIKPTHVIRTPAHQFMIDGTLGNRVIFYGGDNEFDKGPGHKNIDKFAHDFNMLLIKIMTLFNDAQGGSLMAVLENGSGGMTHGGSYYPGWVDNKPICP